MKKSIRMKALWVALIVLASAGCSATRNGLTTEQIEPHWQAFYDELIEVCKKTKTREAGLSPVKSKPYFYSCQVERPRNNDFSKANPFHGVLKDGTGSVRSVGQGILENFDRMSQENRHFSRQSTTGRSQYSYDQWILKNSYTLLSFGVNKPFSSWLDDHDEIVFLRVEGYSSGEYPGEEEILGSARDASFTGQAFFLSWIEPRLRLEVAAEQGDPDAQFKLASQVDAGGVDELIDTKRYSNKNRNFYSNLTSTQSDLVDLYERAAEQGHTGAQTRLGSHYLAYTKRGDINRSEDAAYWFRKAAEAGYAEAQWNLAALYCAGSGVEEDFVACRDWNTKAAKQGYARSYFLFGVMYRSNDYGVPQDKNKAFAFFLKGAELGDVHSMKLVAEQYVVGDFVQRDLIRAMHWYSKAFYLPNGVGPTGLAFARAKGYLRSQEGGSILFHNATVADNAAAQRKIAQMFLRYASRRDFSYTQRDASRSDARRWYWLAATQGDTLAQAEIARIDKLRADAIRRSNEETARMLNERRLERERKEAAASRAYREKIRRIEEESDADNDGVWSGMSDAEFQQGLDNTASETMTNIRLQQRGSAQTDSYSNPSQDSRSIHGAYKNAEKYRNQTGNSSSSDSEVKCYGYNYEEIECAPGAVRAK